MVGRKVSKPKKQSSANDLGDTSAEETFHSPERDENYTDYGFNSTTDQDLDLRPSTSRAAANRTRNQSASSSSLVQSPTRQNRSATLISRQALPKTQPVAKKSTAKPATSKPRRKQTNPIRKEQRFWKEVQALAYRTDNLIPKLPFSRLVREIIMDLHSTVDRITLEALTMIQEASELYITQVLTDAYLLTLHRGRVTLSVKDIQLLRNLKLCS